MVYSEIEALAVNIIEAYYINNLDPFFSFLDESCVFIGPLEGQWFEGAKKIRSLFLAEQGHGLNFSISDIRSNIIRTSRTSCEIILHYRLYTHYESGVVLMDDVRTHMTWKDVQIKEESGGTKTLPRIILIHMSNAAAKSSRDVIYPVHAEDIESSATSTAESLPIDTGVRVFVRCKDHSFVYLISSHILWIESANNSNNSFVRTLNGDYTTTHPIRLFVQKYGDIFLRAHTSYLINPLHVRSLKRFELSMADGTTIPIPEKKYTAFKKSLNEWLTIWHRG